jgi:hypothetical protein
MNPAPSASAGTGETRGWATQTTAPQWGESIPEKIAYVSWFLQTQPQVYRQFRQFGLEWLNARPDSLLSGDAILNRLRWESAVHAVGDNFEVNQNIRSTFVQLFAAEFPSAQFDKRRCWLDVLNSSEWEAILNAHRNGQNAHAATGTA